MPEEVGKPVIVESVVAGQVTRSQLEFTNQLLNRRRMIRSMKNPLDKCTIVSIFPVEINEFKCTIEPGRFHLAPGSYDNPSILVVTSSSWWKDIDIDQPMLEIPVSSIQIADSVIKDYCNGMLGCNMDDAMPGMFFALGEHNLMEIKLKYRSKLDEMKAKQDNWYRVLVRIADSLWARTAGNPLVIWDVMRIAARALNLNDKPWLKDFQQAQLVPCKYCGNLRNPLFPICGVCKAIDPTHPLASEIKFAVA